MHSRTSVATGLMAVAGTVTVARKTLIAGPNALLVARQVQKACLGTGDRGTP